METQVSYCSTTATLFRNPLSIELFRRVRASSASLYHLHSPWYLSSLEAILAIPDDAAVVLTIHGFQPLKSMTAKLLSTAYKPFAQYIFDRVDHTIVLGRSERDRLLKEYDVNPRDVSVIPNGIHPESFETSRSDIKQVQAKYGIDPTTPTVLFLSRLVPLKNPDVLVDAVAKHLPEQELDVLMIGNGDDDYVAELQRRADDRFVFHSNLPFDDIKSLYHAASLFVLPSHMEGLPTVLLEAMNARTPVITTAAGAIGDVITHREHGHILERPPRPESLAAAIQYYLDRPEERREIGRRNRAYVRGSFDWADVAEEIESVYDRALETQGRVGRQLTPSN